MGEGSKVKPSTPWYESNIFWVPVSLAVGIILTVVAGMKHDLRWLLWFAWPFFGVAIWWLARRTQDVIILSALGIAVTGIGLLWLSDWLGPLQEASKPAAPSTPTGGGNTPPLQPVPARPTSTGESSPAPARPSPSKKATTLAFDPKQYPKPDVDPGDGETALGVPKIPAQSRPTGAAPTLPPTTNYAPGGFATSGGYLDHPTVINTGHPPQPKVAGVSVVKLPPFPKFVPSPTKDPQAINDRMEQYRQSLGAERDASLAYLGNPGLTIRLTVDQVFPDPGFYVKCDHPCITTSVRTEHMHGDRYRSVSGLPDVLSPNTTVVVTVRSTDETKPATTANVTVRLPHKTQ